MQGGSARWADGGGSSFQLGSSSSRKESFPRLEGLIRYACESMNVSAQQRYAQENMDAHAAVCDEIISKGIETNVAYYAVYMIVQKYINGQILDNARRGLQLLDSCVKNCGDACHLAVSEKDFLNELVRRFGPTPPVKNVIQQDILKLIETWSRTIAQKSFIKSDLGYIRDMHRLLTNKGFVFPEPDPDDVNALNGLEVKGLQTEDALKERRNLALKARLQAYLRRGGNRNLQEANKIIKVLSDYDQSDKADIRQEAADRIQDVRERTRLLTERLKAVRSGEQMAAGDAFESLVEDLKSEQHKLHNTLQNDRESEDSMSILLGVNEEINRVVEWYDALKAGNHGEAQRLSQGGAAIGEMSQNRSHMGAATVSATTGGLSLIDFEEPAQTQGAPVQGTALQEDLLGLSLNDSGSSQGRISQLPPGFSLPKHSSSISTATNELNGTQQQQQPNRQPPINQPAAPNYNLFNSSPSANLSSNTNEASSSMYQQQRIQSPKLVAPQQPVKVSDPFASIASSARAFPRPQSNSNPVDSQSPVPVQRHTSQQNSLLDLGTSTMPSSNPSKDGAPLDDDWDFSGAPPPEEEEFTVFDEDVKIEFQVSRASNTALNIIVVFTNNTAHPISKLEFLTGMPKLYPRKIDPISSSRLQPHQPQGAYQRFTVENVPQGQAHQVPKIKWRLSRMIQDSQKLNQGEAQSLGIK